MESEVEVEAEEIDMELEELWEEQQLVSREYCWTLMKEINNMHNRVGWLVSQRKQEFAEGQASDYDGPPVLDSEKGTWFGMGM
jgi:hypothetical protein